jgi:hypothetical protein
MKRLLQGAILLAVSVPAIVVACWRSEPTIADYQPLPTAIVAVPAPADSTRRRGPVEDPTLRVRKEPLDAAARAEGQDLLRRMRLQWKTKHEQFMKAQAEGRYGCGWRPPGRFAWEAMTDNTETRLFAFAYPELAEAWVREANEIWDFNRAVVAMGWLWRAGWRTAGEALAQVVRTTPQDEGAAARFLLAEGDREGRYRTLYQDLVRQAVRIAIPKPGSDAWVEFAKRAILEEPGPRFGSQITSALQIASDRREPWLEETVRARMKKAYDLRAVNFSRPSTEDDAYDDVLLTLARIGGTLTQDEYNYLYYYGYSCDPRQRLIDVLREKNYPR